MRLADLGLFLEFRADRSQVERQIIDNRIVGGVANLIPRQICRGLIFVYYFALGGGFDNLIPRQICRGLIEGYWIMESKKVTVKFPGRSAGASLKAGG